MSTAAVGAKVYAVDTGALFVKVSEDEWYRSHDSRPRRKEEGWPYDEVIDILEKVASGQTDPGFVRIEPGTVYDEMEYDPEAGRLRYRPSDVEAMVKSAEDTRLVVPVGTTVEVLTPSGGSWVRIEEGWFSLSSGSVLRFETEDKVEWFGSRAFEACASGQALTYGMIRVTDPTGQTVTLTPEEEK